MAIRIGTCISYKGKYYLDERQSLPKNLDDLKNWNIPVPEGFEVFCNEEWYIFKSSYNSEITGHFEKRNQVIYDESEKVDEELDKIKENIVNIENNIDLIENNITELDNKVDEGLKDLNNQINSFFADKVSDLVRESNWTIDGKNYVRKGIIVSVINDTNERNGAYILKENDYKTLTNWSRLIDSKDLITSKDNTTPSSDNNIYTAKKTDSKFFRKDISETVTQEWNYQRNSIYGDRSREKGIYFVDNKVSGIKEVHGKFDHIEANTSDIKDLPDQIFKYMQQVGVANLLKNTGFIGEFDSLKLNPETPLDDTIVVTYGQQRLYWEGAKTWELVKDENAVFGFAVKLKDDYSYLSQKIDQNILINGESYVLSFKSTGKILVQIDGQVFTTQDDKEYKVNKFRISYSGNPDVSVIFTGIGKICEIKLERGTIGTDWMPAETDYGRCKSEFLNFEYLRTAFKENNENVPSGIILKNILQFENKGGISGVVNKNNIMSWTGGTYEDACRLLPKLTNPYRKLDNTTINSILTYDGKIYAKSIKNINGFTKLKLKNEINSDKELTSITEEFKLNTDIFNPILIVSELSFELNQDNFFANINNIIIPALNKTIYITLFKNGIPIGSIKVELILNVVNLKYYFKLTINYQGKTDEDYQNLTDIVFNSIKIMPL